MQDTRVTPAADRTLRPSSRLTRTPVRWRTWVLDGERSWGSIDVQPGECGTLRHRLVVFPPSITGTERRLLRLSRAWPVWGAALWLMSEVCLSSALRPWAAFGISTMVYLGIEAALIRRVGALRPQARTLSAEPDRRLPPRSALRADLGRDQNPSHRARKCGLDAR
ncbi:DUF6611 family protein [Mycolicibacterium sarraceniae]|uniref:DUF6611 family protein n=1 Tax=Mycolicibacterium sarraceniae TaxID=1534348 RepID=UPI0038994EEA